MSIKLLMFLLGRVALLAGTALLLPLGLAFFEGAPGQAAFAESALLMLVSGLVLTLAGRDHQRKVMVREGALLLVLVWALLGIAGMLPYILDSRLDWLDAAVESVSGFTTTGMSCIADDSPRPFLLWRSLTQWLGGLNILVILVTVLPEIGGCFGMTLSLHQSIAFSQMLGRMKKAAYGVASIYAVFTLILAVLYGFCGLGVFDAVNLSLVTLATGGRYDSPAINGFDNASLAAAAMLGMLVSSGNFLLYWEAARRRTLGDVLRDTELRAFVALVVVFGLVTSWHLWHFDVYDLTHSLRYGFFEVLSFASTTGFAASHFELWPAFDRYVLFILVFVGGCIGSSTGGLKVIRFLVMLKSAGAEMRRTLHPHMIVHIALDGVTIPLKIVGRILSFFFMFLSVFFVFVLLISLSGMTVLESMGLVAACLSSVGPAAMLAGGADTFVHLPAWTKAACCCLMVLGRLEIFSFLIVLQTALGSLRRKW